VIDEAVAVEDPMDGIDRWDDGNGGVVLEKSSELASSPAAVLVELEDALDDLG
jgi:hypothetical protein